MNERLSAPCRRRRLGTPLFLSPHLDDVALSCGGTVALHTRRRLAPIIVTMTAGRPDSLSEADVVLRRCREDAAAAAILGAVNNWLPYLDGIYRGYSEPFGARRPEKPLVAQIGHDLEHLWRSTGRGEIFLPLGLGNHVDHQICASLQRRLRRVRLSKPTAR